MTSDLKGSIVTEQFGKELSVFHLNGDGVEMIHFCNAGNQPRLRMKKTSPSNVLAFEMFDISNLKSVATPHVQRIIYNILNSKKMELEIIWAQDQSESSEKYVLSRIAS